jgi:transposase
LTHEIDEIEDEEHEAVAERVAAIDVAKASGMVCTRVPHEKDPGRRVTKVWQVTTTTNAVMALADELADQGIDRIVVESTSDYWRPFVYLLEARGLKVWLVNAQSVKQVPGRPKTDKLDAVWLAKLNERGMLRPSFIPPIEIRQLRDYTRLRIDLTHDRTRQKERIEKLLEDALIKLSVVAADIFGVSGRAMMEALITGERDPQALAALAKGRMRVKQAALREALTGRFDEHHAELLRILLDQVDALTEKIEMLTGRIEQLIAAIPAAQPPSGAPPAAHPPSEHQAPLPAVERLDEITGVGRSAAQTIIAEVGLNMAQFATAGHLVSWAKLSPRTVQSGAKSRSAGTGRGNPYLRGVLGEAAVATARSDTFLGERYRRLVKRMSKLKALVAVARSILVIVWHLLANPSARFRDLGSDFYATRVNTDRKVRRLVHQLEALLGHKVTLDPAA